MEAAVQRCDGAIGQYTRYFFGPVRTALWGLTSAVFLKHLGSIRNIGLYLGASTLAGMPFKEKHSPRYGFAIGLKGVILGLAMRQVMEGQGWKRLLGLTALSAAAVDQHLCRGMISVQLCAFSPSGVKYAWPKRWAAE